jgi:hypothetical protein
MNVLEIKINPSLFRSSKEPPNRSLQKKKIKKKTLANALEVKTGPSTNTYYPEV